MSFMGGISDFLTGGSNRQADDALNAALKGLEDTHVPSVNELTLPELQKYVQQGLMTPAQAIAALQGSNAYDSINTDPTARKASLDALTKLEDIGGAGGMDPQSQEALYAAQSQANQNTQSQRSSIMDQMAARGIPTSLFSVAQQLSAAGQDAEQAHKDSLQASSDASSRALAALEASGTLGNSISAQQNTEASQKAAAQNAINQWNAANQTTVNLNNAANQQQANSFNTQNAQNVSNANTQNANARTQYNASLPQQVFNDQLNKATAAGNANARQASQFSHEGEQNAGVASTLLGTAAAAYTGMPAGAPAAPGVVGQQVGTYPPGTGSSMMAHGGPVPGHARVPGDSPKNDTVPALLSPGEVVVPRSMAHNPQTAASFIKHLHRQTAQSPVHPDDIKSVLHALSSMRQGSI